MPTKGLTLEEGQQSGGRALQPKKYLTWNHTPPTTTPTNSAGPIYPVISTTQRQESWTNQERKLHYSWVTEALCSRAYLLLERLETSSLRLLLVNGFHQHTLVLELVTLAAEVPVQAATSEISHADPDRYTIYPRQRKSWEVGALQRAIFVAEYRENSTSASSPYSTINNEIGSHHDGEKKRSSWGNHTRF